MFFPPALRPGDLIHVVAPSSPFDRALAWRGLGWLREHYKVQFEPDVFNTEGYLAGSDKRRINELNHAFRSPQCRAIVAIRGGYGLNRIAHRLDWGAFRSHPKWIVGFSDITALHVETARLNIASIHGPMLAMLGRAHAPTRQRWRNALEDPHAPRLWSRLQPVSLGHAQGKFETKVDGFAVGGNLAMLHACAAAGRLHLPDKAILFIEDVGERPYRVDRALTTLVVGSHFDRVRGVILGEFCGCHPGPDGTAVHDVLASVLGALTVPVASGFPIGHGMKNDPIHFGAKVTLSVSQRGANVELRGP
ncbi:MAG: LD-carboxypeptidase [Sorangium cellulosum]|nr:MAG: LD-carboxypeptidase [Sorangium cellulosum]